MIPGTWLAFTCAVFVVLLFFIDLLGRRLGVVDWHYTVARVACEWAVLGFAWLACIALLWHFI